MRSPEGEDIPNVGCYLEVVEHERLVWTTVLGPSFRPPRQVVELPFTAVISLEPAGHGTRYSALAMHGDVDTSQRHADMGFYDGWATALDQLVAAAKEM